MSGISLAIHQFRYDQRSFWRNPASLFFTVMLPLIFFVIFATIFGTDDTTVNGVKVDTDAYYVPAIITLSVISASMVSLAFSLVVARESGVLKRTRGTPMPSWVFIAGKVGNAMVVSVIMLVLLTILGRVVYGVDIPWDHAVAIIVVLVVGTFCFCCLGIAMTALIPSEDAAAPITNATVLPLQFLSGIFIPQSEIPNGVLTFAGIFPIRHIFEAFLAAYGIGGGSEFAWGHIGIVLAWGVAGLILALRFFRWTPSEG